MDTTDQSETPAETLAKRIVERLIAEKLIGAQATRDIPPKLAAGTLTGEDWQLLIDVGSEKGGKE